MRPIQERSSVSFHPLRSDKRRPPRDNPSTASKWLRTDRLLGEHGIMHDSPEDRQLFEAQMERRRLEEVDPETLKIFRRGWCYGSPEFRQRMLQLMEEGIGENHSPEQRRETTHAKAERIIREALKDLGCSDEELRARRKCDPQKVALAARLRKETTLTVKAIAVRLNLGTARNATVRLQEWNRKQGLRESPAQAQLGI